MVMSLKNYDFNKEPKCCLWPDFQCDEIFILIFSFYAKKSYPRKLGMCERRI